MMGIRKPSPAMVVALIALVFAMTGSAAAVVNFARNAGAVDGKSATSSSASTGFAAGKLVAVRKSGTLRGTLPSKFLDPNTVPREFVFGRNAPVIDNAAESPSAIATIPGFGTVTATCSDDNKTAGKEDPRTTISFGNQSGQAIEFARETGTGSVDLAVLANNQARSFAITASNTFTINIEKLSTNLIIWGVVRQNGQGTGDASCIDYGRVSQLG